MVQKKTAKPDRLLTGAELEIMSLIWDTENPTVRSVQERLPEQRRLAYTSVATIMKILEQKGFLTATKADRTLTYQPTIARADYEATTLRHLTQKLFQGNPSSLVMRLLDESELTRDELKSLRDSLNKKLGGA